MINLFSNKDLNKIVKHYKKMGVNSDLSERIYTSRLLGSQKKLVLHGGGNTSVKSSSKDLDGKKQDILYVKGSGSDLSTIGPEGFPAVKISPILKIMKKKFISDKQMVDFLRKNLIDVNSPNPSVETFVHAIIKNKFVDHTHSNALLEIMNRPDGYNICKELYGERFTIIPYVMPGYLLAKKVYEKYIDDKNKIGLLLFKHGIFTYGDTGNISYKRMIDAVNLSERFLKKNKSISLNKIKVKKLQMKPETIAPLIRKYVCKNNHYILNYRSSKKIISNLNYERIRPVLRKGVITPDHVIRIKPFPLLVNIDNCNGIRETDSVLKKAFSQYKKKYKKYFDENKKRHKGLKILDPVPQIILIQNLGIFSIGKNLKEAIVNGDVSETSIESIVKIEEKSRFVSIPKNDIFDVEYWSLEQAKLNKSIKKLTGKVVLVTGGAGTIGIETAKKFKREGAEVAIIDNDEKKINSLKLHYKFDYYLCDITQRKQFKNIISKICKKYGGIDIVISNAGSAHESLMVDISDKDIKNSFQINFFAHQIVASESTKIMLAQGFGGCLLFNISKQAINPGINFGSYGTSKAALLALCKQYALEYGVYGVRSNGVNADRILGGLLTDKLVQSRAKARKLSKNDYLRGNLLKREVLAADVAEAFFHLSISEKTTASIMTVDGGNIEASLR